MSPLATDRRCSPLIELTWAAARVDVTDWFGLLGLSGVGLLLARHTQRLRQSSQPAFSSASDREMSTVGRDGGAVVGATPLL